ncbi:MAG: hydantoinase B/oxoprolinase family protein [Acidobacteria bacterium]|nr:hydantoinase B/oxoprolinase family protein [Acidobacteriota bacterium]
MPKPHDPIELELFRHLFTSLTEEMGIVLRKTSFSANIKERRDYSCALYDASGDTIAMGDHMPVHLGAMPASLAAARAAFPIEPGDVVLLNDPFQGGTHLPDITAVSGVFLPREGKARAHRPRFFLANRAHHADVGGMSPGSMPMAREIYQEGIRIPPVKIIRRGTLDRELLNLILANVRTPVEREGDLLAQFMSLERGAARLLEAVERYGIATVERNARALLDYSERMMRHALSELPRGSFSFEDMLDGDGIGDAPLPIRVRITLDGRSAQVDFTGTAPQSPGSVNANLPITQAATMYVFRCLLTEDVPFTAGLMRAISIHAPAGTLVNALAPAAMAAGNVETSQRITDTLLGALAQAAPQRIPAASCGTMNNVTFGGYDPVRHRPFAYYETIAGGMGAHANGNGLDATHTHMTNSWNTPVEAFEHLYPMRIRAYRVRPATPSTSEPSASYHTGGRGIEKQFEFLTPTSITLLTDRRTHSPYGLQGGAPGAPGRNWIRSPRAPRRTLPAKCRLDAAAGDTLIIETPHGGDFGSLS